MTKTCSKCNETKDLSVFYKKTAYRPKDDGYDYYCKPCRNASAKKTMTSNRNKCTSDNCNKSNYARTLCREHYDKLVRREKKENK